MRFWVTGALTTLQNTLQSTGGCVGIGCRWARGQGSRAIRWGAHALLVTGGQEGN